MFHHLRSKKVQLLFGSNYFRIFTSPEALATPSTPLFTTMTRYSYFAPAGTAFLIMKVNRPDFFVIVVAFTCQTPSTFIWRCTVTPAFAGTIFPLNCNGEPAFGFSVGPIFIEIVVIAGGATTVAVGTGTGTDVAAGTGVIDGAPGTA